MVPARSIPATSSRSPCRPRTPPRWPRADTPIRLPIVDHGTTLTTITLSGSANIVNESSSGFGDGWQLEGLEQITSASGGVILNLGDGGRSLWFYRQLRQRRRHIHRPAGRVLAPWCKNSNGSYTRTLTDGTQITFNSSGYETATIDLNGSAHHLCLQRLEPAHARSPTRIPI